MTTYTYEGPSRKATRKGTCPTCNKPVTRSTSFSATVNPFNRNADGSVKSRAEVAAGVEAMARAWQPEPEVFEHEKCRADRLAPAPGAPTTVDPERTEKTRGFCRALRTVAEFTERHGIPLTYVTVKANLWKANGSWLAETRCVPSGEIVLWMRALGLDVVRVEDGGNSTYIRVIHEGPELSWRVNAGIPKPDLGDRLGGAKVDWDRDSKGRKTGSGTVTVDELAAGLSRMGISIAVLGTLSELVAPLPAYIALGHGDGRGADEVRDEGP
jgi:hypothetical protein